MVVGAQGARLVEAGLLSLFESRRKLGAWGLPWQSSSWDSTVPQQGAQVPSLVWGTEILHAMEWPKKKKSELEVSLSAHQPGSSIWKRATCAHCGAGNSKS